MAQTTQLVLTTIIQQNSNLFILIFNYISFLHLSRFLIFSLDIFGFELTESILSYSIPKGTPRGIEIDLSDKSYDGHEEDERYVEGLGQLVDGQKGKDNFRLDQGFGKGKLCCHNNPIPHHDRNRKQIAI